MEAGKVRVKASFRLGTETHSAQAPNKEVLSEELVSFKEDIMIILKDYITRHNVPNEVPEPDEISSDEDDEESPDEGTPPKSKKRK
ncbi:uncharacterized protein LOC124914941 [Impatiens glandulifera]|uniref:uncharacterized protein LOC124914941 n=1 Tax=Impatiens glandulifera TaxID=253017 RepID=UPI001FB0A63A|nr:uncharacterized protein LOC124914941 [Impatiens glandulifera]